MLNTMKFFTIVLLYILMSSSVFGENKIAYLNVDFILSNANIGKLHLKN